MSRTKRLMASIAFFIGIFYLGTISTDYIDNLVYALNLSRVKTWGTEILTHTDLNAEFDNIINHSITNTDISAAAAISASKIDGLGSTDSPTFAGLTLSGVLAANGDSITSDGVLVINATSTTSFNDENITNVGDIALDSITADGTSITLTATGGVLKPSNPAFICRNNATQSNIAEGTAVTVVFDTETQDIGNNFASNTFTAPVTGFYQLNAFVMLNALDTAAANYQVTINVSNAASDIVFIMSTAQLAADPQYWHVVVSGIFDMDANDTAHISVKQEAAGTVQTDIGAYSIFSGALLQ